MKICKNNGRSKQVHGNKLLTNKCGHSLISWYYLTDKYFKL